MYERNCRDGPWRLEGVRDSVGSGNGNEPMRNAEGAVSGKKNNSKNCIAF